MDFKIGVKSLGKSFFVPIIINSLLIPIIVFMAARTGSAYNTSFAVNVLTQMFTPFLGAFVVCMYMVKYIDMSGNEIYFVVNKNKCREILSLFVVYIVTNTIWFAAYMLINKKFGFEWLHIIIVTFLYMMAAYCLCFLFKSVSLASIPSFLYTIYSVVGLEALGNKLSYYEHNGMSPAKFFSKYIYFVIAAIVVMCIGSIINNLYDSYND